MNKVNKLVSKKALSNDIQEATRFLTLLDEDAIDFTFQTFDDDKKRRDGSMAQIFNGPLVVCFKRMSDLNDMGAGVYVTVNRTDLKGRKNENIKGIRCVFQELDDGEVKSDPIEPSIVVQSSKGKMHKYWIVDDLSVDQYNGILNRMVADYGSDNAAKGANRVLRLPGFHHMKDADNPQMVKIIHESGGQHYKKEAILKAFPPVIRTKPTHNNNYDTNDTDKDLRAALIYVSSDNYQQWIDVGMALKHTGAQYRDLWLEWGSSYPDFDMVEASKTWASFNPDGSITKASIFKLAMNAGWENPAKPLVIVPTKSMIWDNGDNLADNAKAPDFLINDIIEADSHGILGGQSMAFKSFVAIDLAHSICTGNDFFGHCVFKPGKVLYVCGEGQGALSRRIKAKSMDSGSFNDNLRVLRSSIDIDSDKSMERFTDSIADIKPVLVLFDTFSSLTVKTNENANDEVARCLRIVKDSCSSVDCMTSTVLVHHYGKDNGAGFRGASAFKNNVDFAVEMKRDSDSMLAEFSCLKQKDGDHFAPITMKADVVKLGLTRQDGEESTSLVLRTTDEKMRIGKNERPPSENENHLMNALAKVYTTNPLPIPFEIKKNYSIDKSHRVVLTSEWQEESYERLTVDKDSQNIQNAKRGQFNRARTQLLTKNRIITHGNYVWYFDHTEV